MPTEKHPSPETDPSSHNSKKRKISISISQDIPTETLSSPMDENQQPRPLTSLPNEILLNIASCVPCPYASLNLALTCRTMHAVSTDAFRRHEDLSARYSTCIINCNLAPEYTDSDPSTPSAAPQTTTTAGTTTISSGNPSSSTSTTNNTSSTTAPSTHTGDNASTASTSPRLPPNHFRSPITLLHALHKDPSLAYQIREIHFMTTDHGSPLDERLVSELGATDLEAFLVRAAPWMGDTAEDREMWRLDIEGGNHGTALALLLAFLPNVRRVHLAGLLHTYSCWMDMLVRGVAKMARTQQEERRAKAVTQDSATAVPDATVTTAMTPALPLSKIHTLHIEHLEETGGESLHSILPLTLLPSLHTLSCFMVAGYDIFTPPVPFGPFRLPNTFSTLRHVELASCSISPAGLARFVAPMRDLVELRYEHGGEVVAGPEEVCMQEYRREFLREAGGWVGERGLSVELGEEGMLEIKKVVVVKE